MKTTIDLSKLTPRERKAYQDGMAEVRRKLSAAREAKADQAKQSASLLVKRMGADLARKCFGVATSPAAPAKPSPTSKSYSTATATAIVADEPAWPRATRFLSVAAGTGACRNSRKVYSGHGLFGSL